MVDEGTPATVELRSERGIVRGVEGREGSDTRDVSSPERMQVKF